jgi:hypothetical protein
MLEFIRKIARKSRRAEGETKNGLLEGILARHLVSTDGLPGMGRLLDRIEPHMAGLICAWTARDLAALGSAIQHCAKAVDAVDIRAADFKLRVDCLATSSGHAYLYDIHVESKIYEVILEALAGGDDDVVFQVAKGISLVNEIPAPFGFDYVMALLLIRLQLGRGLAKEAVETVNRNLAVDAGVPHMHRYRYIALAQQKATSGLADTPDIALQDLSDRFCEAPFRTLASMSNGRFGDSSYPLLYACACPGMLMYPVSDGTDTQTVDDIWNGGAIQEVRRSILDGDYSYCSRAYCQYILNASLPKKDEIADPRLRDIIDNHKLVLEEAPHYIRPMHDPSCNLACPSCRSEVFAIKNKQSEVLDRFSERILLPMMEDAPVTLYLSGDGDPFGSRHYRQFMRGLDPVRHSKVRIWFLTNGLLLTAREWEQWTNLHGMVASIGVSIDAAEASTYEDLRRPGKWSVITRNMDDLGRLRREGKVPHVQLNFVVQQKNYRQMPAIVEMAQAWGFDAVNFLRIINIGTFTPEEFALHDVFSPGHPEHQTFLGVLRHPILLSPQVLLTTTVQPFFEIAKAASQDEEIAA